MEYIWYNPDVELYQIGSGSMYKLLKRSSKNTYGFTLLYKLKPSLKKLGKKLITELNNARVEEVPQPANVFEFDLAS